MSQSCNLRSSDPLWKSSADAPLMHRLGVFTWLWADWWDLERDRIRKIDKEHKGLKDSRWWWTHTYSQRQPRGERMGCQPVSHRNCWWSTIGTADGTDSMEMLGWGRCGRLRQGSLSPLSESHSTSPPLPTSPIPLASSLINDAFLSDISLVATVSLAEPRQAQYHKHSCPNQVERK